MANSFHRWIVLAACLGTFALAYAQFGGGTGTPEDPYLILTANQLDSLRYYPQDCFRQIADIDLNQYPYNTGNGWVPLCSITDPFTGVYDGNGLRILNLQISGGQNIKGLFLKLQDAEVRNLELEGVQIEDGSTLGVVSGVAEGSLITGCRVSGSLSGYDILGGIAGDVSDCEISACEVDLYLLGHEAGGGIAGWVVSSQITGCTVHFSYAYMYAGFGGIVGYAFSYTDIENCQVSGEMRGGGPHGGIVGEMEYGSVINCRSSHGFLQAGGPVGGIIGRAYVAVDILDCRSSLFVRGSGPVGGIVGSVENGSFLQRCSASGNVEGTWTTGGFAGSVAYGHIVDCFSRGNISGHQSTGGFAGSIGQPQSTLQNCYSTGAVTATGLYLGGFAGSSGSSSVFGCYWDVEASGCTDSPVGMGRTTAQMTWPYGADTYEGWNFSSVWEHDPQFLQGGYPILRSNNVEDADPSAPPATSTFLHVAPNPFRTGTRISFSLPERTMASLEIFDIRGRKIIALQSGLWTRGTYGLAWDGRDGDGQIMPAGIYILRLCVGKTITVRKLTLIK